MAPSTRMVLSVFIVWMLTSCMTSGGSGSALAVTTIPAIDTDAMPSQSDPTATHPRSPDRASTPLPTETPHHDAAFSPTPLASASFSPGGDRSTTSTAIAPTPLPCYRAEFVQDVTFRDGASVAPGEIFIKVWRFRNSGSCEWTFEFTLEFVSGERFSGPDGIGARYFEPGRELALDLGDRDWADGILYRVPPGEVVDIPVVLRAPLEEGRYRGDWRMVTGVGEQVILDAYVDVDIHSESEFEPGVWSGEWEHQTHLSYLDKNPLVLRQQDRHISGYYYSGEGELYLIDGTLSVDGVSMEGLYGQPWQTGYPFALELYPHGNAFRGVYHDTPFTGGAWCGSRKGYRVLLGECLLEP